MIWLTWRHFRTNAAVAAAALATVIALLVTSRSGVADIYTGNGAGALTGFYGWLRLLGTALIGVPAILGAFWGAPLVATEIEAHTGHMVWTQSITRHRWLATKLAIIAVASALLVGAFALTFTWWSAPIDATGNRIGTANFAQRGIVSIGYTLFALALGTLLGTVMRRTLPAMAATLTAFFVVRFGVQEIIRPRLVNPVERSTATFAADQFDGWVLSTRTVNADGRAIPSGEVESLLIEACELTRANTPDVDAALAECARTIGIRDHVVIHPADHFWSLQTYELGVFLLLASLCVATCFWLIQHRTN